MSEAAGVVRDRTGDAPFDLGIVLGSGLGGLAKRLHEPTRISYADLPGFPRVAVSGHEGALIVGGLGGRRVALLSGRAHFYESGDAAAMRGPIACLAALGCPSVLLSNAAGSLRPEVGPGSLVAIRDHINLAGANPLTGETSERRFLNLNEAYSADLRARLARAAEDVGRRLSEGVYAWFAGPSFETPAEIEMARRLGADLVGMSTVPEAILARFFGMEVAAVSAVTNLGAGMTPEGPSHADTKARAAALSGDFEALVEAYCALSA